MAKFVMELPLELINDLKRLESNSEKMIGEMTQAGAQVVYSNVKRNMKRSFKDTTSLDKGLKITKTYKTQYDDGINTKVGFYGYDGISTKRYPKGVPIPLKALAREYGTSRGEARKPFFRKSFKDDEIENAMLKVQDGYLPKE